MRRSRRRATPAAAASSARSRCAGTVPDLPLSVELERARVSTASRDERERLVAEQDLARAGGLLEPGGDVDRVTRDERVPLAGHHRAGVDADPGVEPELLDDVAELDRRANGAQRVVLARDRDAEHRHHRVADELLDGAAVPLEHAARGVVVAVHQRAQRLRVGALPDRRRAGEVAEQHRHDLPHLARGDHGERRAATGTESEVVGALAPARRADRHEASLRSAQEPVNDLRTRQE